MTIPDTPPTDAEVEAALAAFYAGLSIADYPSCAYSFMRDALRAAAAVRAPSPTDAEKLARRISEAAEITLYDDRGGDDPLSDADHDLIVAALTAAARAPAPQEWQPIETAPKDMAILIYNFAVRIAHFNTNYGYWIGYGHGTSDTRAMTQFPPTHWHPLPAPPATEEEGK